MSEDDQLRRRLARLAEKTATPAIVVPGWFAGDVAGERRVHDDMSAGRLDWQMANHSALQGLTALESGDRSLAEAYAWQAVDKYIAALEGRIRPDDLEILKKPAQRRGRPRKK